MDSHNTIHNYRLAKKKFDKLVEAKAREMFEGYDRYPADDYEPGFEGGVMTQEACRQAAIRELESTYEKKGRKTKGSA